MNNKVISGFNGSIVTYDINYIYREGITFLNGQVSDADTKLVSLAVEDLYKGKPDISLQRSGCEPVSPTFVGFPGSMCEGGLVTYKTTTVTDADGCTISITHTFLGIMCPGGGSGSGSGSGSGGGNGNPPYGGGDPGGGGSNTIFISFPGYPCATNVAKSIPNLQTRLAEIINNTFAKNDKVNLHFDVRGQLAGTNTDGELYQSSPQTDYHIGINPDVLSKSSKEYMIATFFHESMHAYLRNKAETLSPAEFNSQFSGWEVNGGRALLVQDQAHWTMGYTNFIVGIKDAILAFNPNFNPDRAMVLAKAGILILTPQETLINAQERDTSVSGYTGTKCL